MSNIKTYTVVRSGENTVANVVVTYDEGALHFSAKSFLNMLKSSITKWITETASGKKAFLDSAEDFNVGDLSLVSDEDMQFIVSNMDLIKDIKVETEEFQGMSCWDFDTRLFYENEVKTLTE